MFSLIQDLVMFISYLFNYSDLIDAGPGSVGGYQLSDLGEFTEVINTLERFNKELKCNILELQSNIS